MMPPNPSPKESGPRWRGRELLQRPDWELAIDRACADELLAGIEATGSTRPEDLSVQQLALPRLAQRLLKVREQLETGSGARLMRGMPLDELSDLGIADAIPRAFLAIALHVGTPVSQNERGESLLHVRDEGHAQGDPRVRGPNTNKRLSFHTDRCDVIGFLCKTPAQSGGETHLISSVTLHDELSKRYPRELELLKGAFPYLRHTVDPGNRRAFIEQPIFSEHEGHFAASFLRVLIDRAHRDPAAPSLAAEQIAALDTLETVAEDEDLYARVTLAAGDMLLLNNWVTFHRRTAFQDAREPSARRHLLRLWLAVPNSRPLAPCFADHFGATAAGALRGGIHPRGAH